MTEFDYDLFTIGAGSAGVRASRLAAETGARVVVAEEDKPGGTCVIRGCVPKKLFVYASAFKDDFRDAEGFGWTVSDTKFDWSRLRDSVQDEVGRLSHIYERNLKIAGAELIKDRAEITGPNSVKLIGSGKEVTAKHILVSVGAWPHFPEKVAGIEHAISSNEVFHLEQLPERMVIVGGGYIAVEFAGIMNGLGVDVTLLYRGAEVLRGFDLDLRAMLRQQMENKGIRVMIESDVKCIEKNTDHFTVVLKNEKEIPTDLVLYATGRRPKTPGMGLEQAGVALDSHGAVKVDAYSQTTVPSIYAIGDVTDRMNLTPIAIREGICFAETVFKANPMAMDYCDVPTAVFSQPPIGTVGYSEEDALKEGYEVDIYKSAFRAMRHAFASNEEQIFMKLVVDAKTDRILGAHMMGHEAGELIQALGIAVKKGVTKAEWDATVAVHPTAAEEFVTMREKYETPEMEVDHTGHHARPRLGERH